MLSPLKCRPGGLLALLVALLVALLPRGSGAQGQAEAEVGGRTYSIGQPRPWSWLAGAASGSLTGDGGDRREVPQLRLGAFRPIGNSVANILGVQFEAYAGARTGEAEFGTRARLMMPFLRFGIGADHSFSDSQTRLAYSFLQPVRRGGILGYGTTLRFDYVPARDHSLTLGMELPILQRVPAGRTRPLRDHVRITGAAWTGPRSGGVRTEVAEAMAVVRESGSAIRALAVPFLGRDPPTSGQAQSVRGTTPAHLREVKQALALGSSGTAKVHTIEDAARQFHDALDRAFAAALSVDDVSGGEEVARGRRVGDEARDVLLLEVLLPYDRLLGQLRRPDDTRRFALRARTAFTHRIATELGGNDRRRDAALGVFDLLLEIVEGDRATLAATWGDSRFVWLPLQYALRPEQHDTQEELDALVALATETGFSEGNFVSYVINEQFQYQLSRTIHAAEQYHVLWTHDFRGVDDVGDPDEMSFRQVVRSYLAAMTERVRAYDSTGTFPTYLIVHDQWYYSVRRGSLFLDLLEDPTRHRLRLPAEFRAWADTIAAAQEELRVAIAASALLQSRRRQYGDRWLRDLVKVHVNVTNSPDNTFWSWHLIRGIPVGDQLLRDHRKLVFYDIGEDDPYRGEAIFTGAGVGEHYSNLSWEDRSLLVRGPALARLPGDLRALLSASGVSAERMPSVLRARPRPPGYDDRVRLGVEGAEWPLRALSVHNAIGYADKNVNVAKAVIYTLMPSGSVIIVPDSFWASEFWGAALFGAALRGGRVMVIAPAHANNSVAYFGTQLLTRELLSRMLVARAVLADELAASGGMMQVGVFESRIPVADIPGKVRAVRGTFERHAWLRDLFGFPPEVYGDLASLDDRIAELETAPVGPGVFEFESRTKLHLKANYFASREAWQLMTIPEWSDILWSFVTQRIAQVQSSESVRAFERPPDPLLEIGSGAVRDWYDALEPAVRERVIFYTVVGSQNQNYRSMVADAEVAFVVAKWPSVIPYLDAIALIGQSHWVESQGEIDRLLPPVGPVKVRLTHWARLVH